MYEKGTPLYAIPEDIEGKIKRDIVPQVLKQPLSPSTYKAFFAALLYAEDYYLQVSYRLCQENLIWYIIPMSVS